MKKFTVKTLAMALVFVCAAILSSCSCSRDKKDLLSFVPADTAGVAVIDLTNLWDQLEIKADGDDLSYCSELKDLLKLSNVKNKDLDKVAELLKMFEGTAKTIVIFEYEDAVWGTFYVKDGDDFIKTLEDEGKADFDKEDGYKVWEHMAVKGDQVWFCVNPAKMDDDIDPEAIEKLADLDKDKRFDKKYEKIAEYMLGEDVCSAYCINIDKVLDYVNNSYDRQMCNMALSMVFDDAKFLVGQSKLNDKGMTGEVRVLNEKENPAKFLLPMAKIEAAGLSKLNNNAPLIAAVAVNPELVQKIKGVIEKMDGPLSQGDQEMFSILGAISGTSGLSFATPTDGTLVLSFNNPDTPSQLGSLLAEAGTDVEFSTAGTQLIGRLAGSPAAGQGQAPSQLVGQYAGIYIDAAKEGGKLISGYDLSKLGKMWLTLGPDGDGVKLCSAWEIKNPMRTLLKEILAIAQGFMSNSITSPALEEMNRGFFVARHEASMDSAYMDSTYMYDDYYYDEYATPAPEAAPAVEAAPAADDYAMPAEAAK